MTTEPTDDQPTASSEDGADAARGPFVRPLREDKGTKTKGSATKD